MEKVQAMLWAAGLPQFLWGEALLHAVFLKNCTSTKALNSWTPYEVVNQKPPDPQDLSEWGCKMWVHDEKTGKVGTRANKGCWVGHDDMSAVYRIYWPDKKSVGVERNDKFSVTYEATPHDNDVLLKGEDVELDELGL